MFIENDDHNIQNQSLSENINFYINKIKEVMRSNSISTTLRFKATDKKALAKVKHICKEFNFPICEIPLYNGDKELYVITNNEIFEKLSMKHIKETTFKAIEYSMQKKFCTQVGFDWNKWTISIYDIIPYFWRTTMNTNAFYPIDIYYVAYVATEKLKWNLVLSNDKQFLYIEYKEVFKKHPK